MRLNKRVFTHIMPVIPGTRSNPLERSLECALLEPPPSTTPITHRCLRLDWVELRILRPHFHSRPSDRDGQGGEPVGWWDSEPSPNQKFSNLGIACLWSSPLRFQ